MEAPRQIRENAYAYSKEQFEPRICFLAVPVRDIAGQYIAGINVILQDSLASEKAMAARELGAMLAPRGGAGAATT